jgi:hypothetical protein
LDGTTAHFFVCQRTRPPAESAEPCVLRRVAQGVDLIAGGRTQTKHNAEERECVPAAAAQGEQRTHSLCPPIDAAATACASAQRSAVACVVASSPLCQRTRPRQHAVREAGSLLRVDHQASLHHPSATSSGFSRCLSTTVGPRNATLLVLNTRRPQRALRRGCRLFPPCLGSGEQGKRLPR